MLTICFQRTFRYFPLPSQNLAASPSSFQSSNTTKKSIKGKLTLSNFLLPVLQLFRTVTDVDTQNCIETFMLGKQKPLVKQPGDWPGGFL